MTVASSTSKSGPYAGNGTTTVFAFGFKVQAAADIKVVTTVSVSGVATDTTLAQGADYTVTLNADQDASPGGSITGLVAPPTGTQLTVLRNVTATQGASLPNQGGFYPKVIENALDKLSMLVQQLFEESARSLKVSAVSAAGSLQDILTSIASSVTAAASSASSASSSATTATAQAGIATDEAGTATSAADAAADSATTAMTQADNAATSATTSAAAAAAAAGSATSAATSDTNAAASAAAAAGSATTATTQATNAAVSATAAANSATAAAGSDANAVTSAVAAAASATSAASYAAALIGASATSLAIGVGVRVLTTQSGKQFATGQYVIIPSAADPTNYMHGQVTGYSGTSLTVNVLDVGGTGTHADWLIYISGTRGAIGPIGASGSVPIGANGGTVDAITATITSASTTDQQIVAIVSSGANTSTTPTFKLGADTAHTVTTRGGSALLAGDIGPAGYVALFEYNLANTRWELLNPVTPLKTINGASVLGSGNLDIAPGAPIATYTVSSPVAAINFLSLFSATYDNYRVVGYNISVSSADEIRLRMANAGALDTGGNYSHAGRTQPHTGAGVDTGAVTASTYPLAADGNGINPSSHASFDIRFRNVNSSAYKQLIAEHVYEGSNFVHRTNYSGCNYTGGVATGFGIYLAGGNNFDAGTIKVYGEQKS